MNTDSLQKYLMQSKEFGFLSPKEIEEQIMHSKELFEMLPVFSGELLDVGAGGGLPSFVFMNQENRFKFTLLDAMNKRTDFLKAVSGELDKKDRFKVINGRAETIARMPEYENEFDIVVARGFGSPSVVAECSTGFIKLNGYLFVSGSPDGESLRWDVDGLKLLGLNLVEVKEGKYSTGVVIQKVGAPENKYPRRDGVPRRKPIW